MAERQVDGGQGGLACGWSNWKWRVLQRHCVEVKSEVSVATVTERAIKGRYAASYLESTPDACAHVL